MSKALELLKKAPTVEQRASQFMPRIKKSIQTTVLDPLQETIDELESQKFELMTFSLDTDINKGQGIMSKDECQRRFVEYMDAGYKQDLAAAELKSKQKSFDEMFTDNS